MVNGNGNGHWTRWVIGVLVGIALFFGGYSTKSGVSNDSIGGRVTRLEVEADKGERWTGSNQRQHEYNHNLVHTELAKLMAEQSVKIDMICKATDAGC